MAVDAPEVAEVVTVSLADLQNDNVPFEKLQAAFGPDSLGIMVVKDVAQEFAQLRRQTLSYASYLANLPEAELAKLEKPTAQFLTGWSLGKEKLKEGQVDTFKGSYYANCAFYVDPTAESATPTADFSRENFPEYLDPNVWPAEDVLPGFKATVEQLCRLMIDTAVLVARACDRFAEKEIANYPHGYVEHCVKNSTTTKARLLHYFPLNPNTPPPDEDDDQWCTTHLDHGCLTALTSAMYIDEAVSPATDRQLPSGQSQLPPLKELAGGSPDPSAGLYIKSRSGNVVKVNIPRDCIGFQTGETLERITQGQFKAVPHFVRGIGHGQAGADKVVRNTLAVFTQPNLDEEVDRQQHINFGEFSRGVVTKNTVY